MKKRFLIGIITNSGTECAGQLHFAFYRTSIPVAKEQSHYLLHGHTKHLSQLQLEMAQRANITVSDTNVSKAVAEVAKQNHFTVDQLKNALEKQGIDSTFDGILGFCRQSYNTAYQTGPIFY